MIIQFIPSPSRGVDFMIEIYPSKYVRSDLIASSRLCEKFHDQNIVCRVCFRSHPSYCRAKPPGRQVVCCCFIELWYNLSSDTCPFKYVRSHLITSSRLCEKFYDQNIVCRVCFRSHPSYCRARPPGRQVVCCCFIELWYNLSSDTCPFKYVRSDLIASSRLCEKFYDQNIVCCVCFRSHPSYCHARPPGRQVVCCCFIEL